MAPALDPITFSETIHVRALSRGILVVAVTRIEGRWKAYIGVVPGVNHDNEWREVWKDGDQLEERFARPMFPEFDHLPYAR